ncbi:MAG: hypothetical protein ABR540_00185 [Acidimicrobiales bacterium]
MNEEEAAAEVRRLAKAWLEESGRAEAAKRRAAGLMMIMRGYIEMFPELRDLPIDLNVDLGDPIPIDAPRGAEAVRLVLQDTPNNWWLVSELVEALKGRHWLPESDNPANAVRTALERLLTNETSDVRKGKQNGKVVYGYFPDEDVPTYDYGEEPF